MINLLIPKMVFSVDVLGQLLLCLNYFQWGMGGVGWGFNEEQDLQQALVLGRCLVMLKKKVFMDVRR